MAFRTYARILGLLLLLVGGFMLKQRGIVYPIHVLGNVVPVPIYGVFLILGIGFVVAPTYTTEFVLSLLPERARRVVRRAVKTAIGKAYPQAAATETPDLAVEVRNYMAASNRRFAIATVFVVVCLPGLVLAMLDLNGFTRESERLMNAIQETNLTFSAADQVTLYLVSAEPSLNTLLVPESATRSTYGILRDLYSSSVTTVAAFDRRMGDLYERHIRSHVDASTGLIRMGEITLPDSPLETVKARITYLSVLAVLCNRQGDHGKYLEPYLQGRQLLHRAFQIGAGQQLKLPMTKNLLGQTSASFLKRWDAYEAAYKKIPGLLEALGEGQSSVKITLARKALDEYRQSADDSWTALSKSRQINNQVDLLITLVYETHFAKNFDPNKVVSGADDEAFVRAELVPNDDSSFPVRLVRSLNKRSEDLDTAITNSKSPEIYFTHAQLYTLGARLAEKYSFGKKNCPPSAPALWCNPSALAQAAVDQLTMARSTGLPPRFFSSSEAEALGVAWLWRQADLRRSLEGLARP